MFVTTALICKMLGIHCSISNIFLTSSNIFILCVMLRIVTHILSFKCVAKNVSWQKQTYVFKNAKGISHVYGHNPNLWRPFRRSYVGRSEIINMVKTIVFVRNDLYTNNILNITKYDPLVPITSSSQYWLDYENLLFSVFKIYDFMAYIVDFNPAVKETASEACCQACRVTLQTSSSWYFYICRRNKIWSK